MTDFSRINTNAGHGHAWERPDGHKARCGGPRICPMCAEDAAMVAAALEKAKGPDPHPLKTEATTATEVLALVESDDPVLKAGIAGGLRDGALIELAYALIADRKDRADAAALEARAEESRRDYLEQSR